MQIECTIFAISGALYQRVCYYTKKRKGYSPFPFFVSTDNTEGLGGGSRFAGAKRFANGRKSNIIVDGKGRR